MDRTLVPGGMAAVICGRFLEIIPSMNGRVFDAGERVLSRQTSRPSKEGMVEVAGIEPASRRRPVRDLQA